MKPEFEIEQIRDFVNKGYTSVSARYVKAALQHYDELVKNCIKPAVMASASEMCMNCTHFTYYSRGKGFVPLKGSCSQNNKVVWKDESCGNFKHLP